MLFNFGLCYVMYVNDVIWLTQLRSESLELCAKKQSASQSAEVEGAGEGTVRLPSMNVRGKIEISHTNVSIPF